MGSRGRETGENFIMRSFMVCILFTKYYSGDQIEEGEIGKACGTCRVETDMDGSRRET